MDTKDTKVRTKYLVLVTLSVLGVLCGEGVTRAQFQMPDAKTMSGIPRPVTDLPDGSISVRVIRGDLSNNIKDQPVELRVGGKVITVKTDENGRAQFDAVTTGVNVQATTTVDGERIDSQEFPVPARGGVRLMLVATDKSKAPATQPNAPAVAGAVVIGNESRIVIQPVEEAVQVFYLLDISNTARVPVKPPTPFVVDLPTGAQGATIMEGSTPTATVSGKRVVVDAPFAPGHTFAQVAFVLTAEGGTADLSQRFPANFEQLAVVVKKLGDTTLESRQVTNQRDMPAQGETYIAATGGAIPAGTPVELTIGGIPHHNQAPRLVALTLASVIVVAGVWAAGKTDDRDPQGRAAERKRLIARREKLLNDLVKLEQDHRRGRGDARRHATRREELMAALEQVYSALDDDIGSGAAA
jgi:hypothetical protein